MLTLLNPYRHPTGGPTIPVIEQWGIYPNTTSNYSFARSNFGDTAGHLLVMLYFTTGLSIPPASGPLSGWTRDVAVNGGSEVGLGVYHQISSAPGGNIFAADSGNPGYIAVLRVSGFNNSNPIQVVETATATTSSPASPAATVASNGSLVLRIMSADDDDAVAEDAGYPSGTTGLFLRERGTQGPTAGAAYHYADAGSAGSAAWTSQGATEEVVTATIVVNAQVPL